MTRAYYNSCLNFEEVSAVIFAVLYFRLTIAELLQSLTLNITREFPSIEKGENYDFDFVPICRYQ